MAHNSRYRCPLAVLHDLLLILVQPEDSPWSDPRELVQILSWSCSRIRVRQEGRMDRKRNRADPDYSAGKQKVLG